MRTWCFFLSLVGAVASGALGFSWLQAIARGDCDRYQSLWWSDCMLRVSAYSLLAALVLGCVGGLLVLRKKNGLASPLLFGCGLLPGILEPRAFVVTFVLILAAFLASTNGHASRATE